MDSEILGLESGKFYALLAVIAGANLLIWYFLIRYAVKANSRNEILYIQARLISRLLIQQGVPVDEIKTIVDQAKDDGGDVTKKDYSRIIPGLNHDGNQIIVER